MAELTHKLSFASDPQACVPMEVEPRVCVEASFVKRVDEKESLGTSGDCTVLISDN